MQTIYKLSLLLAKGADSAIVIGNYLDEFKISNREERLYSVSTKPFDKLKKKHSAYLAAVVEELCIENKLKIPTWVNKKKYFLKYPIFYTKFESLKAILIKESPIAFRRRNLFVSENILSRV